MDASRKNAELEIRWGELKRINECEELNRQIESLNGEFSDIVKNKDNLITEFWGELKQKDDDYVKMLKDHSLDIS